MTESIGPPHQMSNCGLAFSLRRRVSASPDDKRTNSTVTVGYTFWNSAFIPSHQTICGVHSKLSVPESSGGGPGAWLDTGPEALAIQTRTTSTTDNDLGIGDFSSGGDRLEPGWQAYSSRKSGVCVIGIIR